MREAAKPKSNEYYALQDFSQFEFKKANFQQHFGHKKGSYKSHNCTPKKLSSLKKTPDKAICLAQSKKSGAARSKPSSKIKQSLGEVGLQNLINPEEGANGADKVSCNMISRPAKNTSESIAMHQDENLSSRVLKTLSPKHKFPISKITERVFEVSSKVKNHKLDSNGTTEMKNKEFEEKHANNPWHQSDLLSSKQGLQDPNTSRVPMKTSGVSGVNDINSC